MNFLNPIIFRINSGNTNNIDPDVLKEFILQASYAINSKILYLEKKYNVNIKLPPLSKTVPSIRNNSGAIFSTMGITQINTGMTGTIMRPTQLNINPMIPYGPFLLDPINGMNGENYKQRLAQINQSLKVYQTVKPQLDTWESNGRTDSDKAKVNSRYVQFLDIDIKGNYNNNDPSDDSDIDSIKDFLDSIYGKTSTPKPPSTTPTPSKTTPVEEVEKLNSDVLVLIDQVNKLSSSTIATSKEELKKTIESKIISINDKIAEFFKKTGLKTQIDQLKALVVKLTDEGITVLDSMTGGLRFKYKS